MKLDELSTAFPEVQVLMDSLNGEDRDLSVVLVGSAARGTQSENSDIDILIVSRQPLICPNVPGRIHLVKSTYDEFLKQLQIGEDFEAWCVRLGVPLLNAQLWSEILARPEARTWPNWKRKIVHGARRLFLASRLISMGDLDAGREEMLYATGHIARGLLLKSDIFPLSRPELEVQLQTIGYPHLASVHRELRVNPTIDFHFLRRSQTYSKKLLKYLGAQEYKLSSLEFQKKRRDRRLRRERRSSA
jgi:hypothetical protein